MIRVLALALLASACAAPQRHASAPVKTCEEVCAGDYQFPPYRNKDGACVCRVLKLRAGLRPAASLTQ